MTRLPPVPLAGALLAALLLAGCAEPRFFEEENPGRLSDWKLFRQDGSRLLPHAQSLVFAPANPLFSDYAGKLRTMWIPAGSAARIESDALVFPIGSVLSKTFYYPRSGGGLAPGDADHATALDTRQHQVLETRLLVRRDDGWHAMAYVWNEAQSEAFLRVAGASLPVSLEREAGAADFVYFVPNENQCAGCHVTEHPDGPLRPLGAVPDQLAAVTRHAADVAADVGHPSPNNQTDTQTTTQTATGHPSLMMANEGQTQPSYLQAMQARGWLADAPTPAAAISWEDETANLESRAGAYLNIHCGHCHNPDGAADTSALVLDGNHRNPVELGVCKSPVAAGGGAGSLLFNIHPGAPERSILLYRMESAEPDEMMPELGRSLPHAEGIALLREWIAAMPGDCPEPARGLGNR